MPCLMAMVNKDTCNVKTNVANSTGIILFVNNLTVISSRQPVIQSEIARSYSAFLRAINSVTPCHPRRTAKKALHRFLRTTTAVTVFTSLIAVQVIRSLKHRSALKTSARWLWRIAAELPCSAKSIVMHFTDTSTPIGNIFSASVLAHIVTVRSRRELP